MQQKVERDYVIDAPETPFIPIKGSDKVFPVRRIYCIGRNYADHAIEMGHDPDREPPFFFMKNPDNILHAGQAFPYPPKTEDVHHEIELVVGLKSGGRDISFDAAMGHVYGFGVGLDMTRRDLQGEAKTMGRPWEVGKSFRGVSTLHSTAADRRNWADDGRGDLVEGQWRNAPAGRSQSDDLENSRNDCRSLQLL